MAIRTIDGVTIMENTNKNRIFHNSKSNAYFSITNDDVCYNDPFGNRIISYPCRIRINFELFQLEKMGDEIRRSDGTMIIMMPKKQIQEIADKTFYKDGQFHCIDFLTLTITEQK